MAQTSVQRDAPTVSSKQVSNLIRFAAIPNESLGLALASRRVAILLKFQSHRQRLTSHYIGNCANKLHVAKQVSLIYRRHVRSRKMTARYTSPRVIFQMCRARTFISRHRYLDAIRSVYVPCSAARFDKILPQWQLSLHAWQASVKMKPRRTPRYHAGPKGRRSSVLATVVKARIERSPNILLGLLGSCNVFRESCRAVLAAVDVADRHFKCLVVQPTTWC